jgi:hypothetical protein
MYIGADKGEQSVSSRMDDHILSLAAAGMPLEMFRPGI